MIGTYRRLARLFEGASGRSVILALDHGASLGMIEGMERFDEIIEGVAERNIQGVVLNKGFARTYGSILPLHPSLVVQLSAGTKHGLPDYNKALVCGVGEALRLGADAVSVHLNIGNDLEDRMLVDMGAATDEAHGLGLPVLATVQPRGGQIVNGLDPSLIGHCIRLGAELASDVVCAPYSGDAKSFGAAVTAAMAPVLVTGGPVTADFDDFLNMAGEALEAGAAGVIVGRNIFQAPDPLARLDRIIALVHGTS
jgi:class I fructose-bisphosphate aldolase